MLTSLILGTLGPSGLPTVGLSWFLRASLSPYKQLQNILSLLNWAQSTPEKAQIGSDAKRWAKSCVLRKTFMFNLFIIIGYSVFKKLWPHLWPIVPWGFWAANLLRLLKEAGATVHLRFYPYQGAVGYWLLRNGALELRKKVFNQPVTSQPKKPLLELETPAVGLSDAKQLTHW